MSDSYDAARIHEILAILILILLVPTAAVAFAYIRALGAFFSELKQKEPDVWQKVGAPGFGMAARPFMRSRTYYAFYPVLRERAARQGGYRHAARAYRLLRVGLVMTAAVFVLGGMVVFWMVYHDL
jgi:flagellar basal body-associated protein FliL